MTELQYRPNHYDDWGMIRNADGSMHASVHRPETYGGEFDECREEGTDPFADLARKIIFYDDLEAENASLRQLLSEAEKREREARSPFEIVADWHDKQARTFKEMAQDVRAGELGRAKAVEASKHHAGSAAALRLHVLNERRAALERSEG